MTLLYHGRQYREAANPERDVKYQKEALRIAKAVTDYLKKLDGLSEDDHAWVVDNEDGLYVMVDVSLIALDYQPISLSLMMAEDMDSAGEAYADEDDHAFIDLNYFEDEDDVQDHAEGRVSFDLAPLEDTLVHELIHVLDGFRDALAPDQTQPSQEGAGDAYDTRYYSSPNEFNAFFQAGAAAVWKEFSAHAEAALHNDANQRVYIEIMLEGGYPAFLTATRDYWDERFLRGMDDKMQRKFKLRLYQFYEYLLDQADDLWLRLTGKTTYRKRPRPTAYRKTASADSTWEQVQDDARTGTPLVMLAYHGTNADTEGFVFDPAMIGTSTDEGWLGRGFYFTPHLDVAQTYGRNVLQVRLTLRSPFVFPDDTNPLRFVKDMFGQEDKQDKSEKFTQWVKGQGHDGVVSTSLLHQVCVFDPRQIEILGAEKARTAGIDDTNYLYHVTLVRNLDSIAEEGLQPGSSSNWPGYSSHARGKVFLTEGTAVSEWVHKVFYAAEGDTDYPVEEGYIPVVLRVASGYLEDPVPDDLGSKDVLSGASYYVEDTIEPDALEVYVPTRGWVAVDRAHPELLIEYAYEHADKEIEDGEEIVWPDEHVFTPS